MWGRPTGRPPCRRWRATCLAAPLASAVHFSHSTMAAPFTKLSRGDSAISIDGGHAMTRMLGVIVAAGLLAVALAAPAGAGDVLNRVMANKKLVNALDVEYPPFSFLDVDKTMDGFDVDVAKEVAKRLGVEIEQVTPGWDVITAGKWVGRWDISIGSMTPTKERTAVL